MLSKSEKRQKKSLEELRVLLDNPFYGKVREHLF